MKVRRFFLRLLTRRTLLYTEMVTTGAALRGDRERLLAHDPAERPLALQLGGSDPGELAQSARVAAELQRAGFAVEWDGTFAKRIFVPHFDWKKR